MNYVLKYYYNNYNRNAFFLIGDGSFELQEPSPIRKNYKLKLKIGKILIIKKV